MGSLGYNHVKNLFSYERLVNDIKNYINHYESIQKFNKRKKYQIPSILDDKKNIDSFIDQNNEKPIIVVQGLGFVGAVMSLVCANAINGDYAVIGIDLPTKDSYWKIASINDGIFPVTSSDKKVGHFLIMLKKK